MLKLKPLALAAMLSCSHGVVAAQSDATSLGDITVQDDKVMDDNAATLTVITREDIQERGARSIKDVLAEEPDVAVRTRPSNFTATRSSYGRGRSEGINVRGIEGNRLLIVQDGIRLPNSFSFGPAFQTGRGDYWDVDSLRKIEILRGPNSVQYGADSIAGVVSASALQVHDLVKAGRTRGGFVQGSYAQQDNSFNHSAGIGFDDGRWQAMFMGSRRRGHETWSQEHDQRPDNRRTAPNPMNVESRYNLGRAGLQLNPAHLVRVTLESVHNQVDIDGFTAVSPWPVFRKTRELTAHDVVKRERISLEHYFKGQSQGWLTQLHSHLYLQRASTRQFTYEQVFGPATAAEQKMFDDAGGFSVRTMPGALQRTRDNSYNERTTGFALLADGRLSTGMVEHRLRYGVDLSRAEISALLDGTVPMATKVFPARPLPDSGYFLAGVFVQDEIAVGSLRLIPGLRYDRYRMSPDMRSLSASDLAAMEVSGATVAGQSGSALTPRLGIIWEVIPEMVPYFSYAQGFRAPEPGQVNANFSSPIGYYEAAGNPGLRPERVISRELGVRGRFSDLAYSVAGFDSRYTDFIDLRPTGFNPVTGYTVYRSVNYAKAHVRGFEARAEWTPAPAWRFNAAWAYTRGDVFRPTKVTELNPDFSFVYGEHAWQPLNSVQPMRMILGARYRQERWGAYANLEHSWGKTPSRVAPAPGRETRMRTRAFTVVGVGAHVKPVAAMTVSLNIENLFNATYERWSDVGELEVVDRRYSAPPRSLQLSLRTTF
ncbi:TonB-dependent hemoglobin/transferrin/lactoferrin family receptor [Herbaspirillum sp. alder98]|uniref:TonB-dependent hemoglobin/transferrin/lactoferrin family receptor n=1 Tax=Herbaspirillum sp. alder98 TaxID=2913096 RepID=UPI001CD8EB5E|nr:TonB-dependent hemoglobin/transferrin/lactoferrin family receptor [Herbaspirillum sp. alder98]MCA1324750.1 TonB-dependent hemoglobin/transferrin/lactoferrin family receptor [Herbaspirillum sp. alder98]